MRVTVAVLTYNEEKNIPDLLESLRAQTFPTDQFEVMIVDNCSVDGTLAAVGRYRSSMPNLRIVSNVIKGIAPGRNVALRNARGSLVAFTDADVVVCEDWLATLAAGFEKAKGADPKAAAVGGGNVPHGKGNRFLDAVGITLNSFWGSHGSTQGMVFKSRTQVAHIPTLNILYDKNIVLAQGGFDENFRMVCEDPELNHRLGQAGFKIYFLPGATVQHKMRPSLIAWLKNVFLYGQGRTQLLKKHHDHFSWMYLFPPLLALALATVFIAPWHPIFLLPIMYFAPPLAIAISLCSKAKRFDCLLSAFLILALNPIAYGLGMIYALFVKKT